MEWYEHHNPPSHPINTSRCHQLVGWSGGGFGPRLDPISGICHLGELGYKQLRYLRWYITPFGLVGGPQLVPNGMMDTMQ